MTCEQARPLLAELAYRESDYPQVAAHIRSCERCAAELSELEGVRRLLEAAPAPVVHVDVAALYRRAAAEEQRKTTRWRRAALAAGAMAAGVLLLLALRVELRWHDRELVIGWGAPAPAPARSVLPERIIEKQIVPAHLAMELQVLRDLIHAMAADVGQRDQAQRDAVATLRERVDRLAYASSRNWSSTQNDVRALYTAYLGMRPKGDTP